MYFKFQFYERYFQCPKLFSHTCYIAVSWGVLLPLQLETAWLPPPVSSVSLVAVVPAATPAALVVVLPVLAVVVRASGPGPVVVVVPPATPRLVGLHRRRGQEGRGSDHAEGARGPLVRGHGRGRGRLPWSLGRHLLVEVGGVLVSPQVLRLDVLVLIVILKFGVYGI